MRDCRPGSAEIMGCKLRKLIVSDDAANGLAERMTGKRRHPFELAGEHRPIVRAGLINRVGRFELR